MSSGKRTKMSTHFRYGTDQGVMGDTYSHRSLLHECFSELISLSSFQTKLHFLVFRRSYPWTIIVVLRYSDPRTSPPASVESFPVTCKCRPRGLYVVRCKCYEDEHKSHERLLSCTCVQLQQLLNDDNRHALDRPCEQCVHVTNTQRLVSYTR